MRFILVLALVWPVAAGADRILATSRVVGVTIYPMGAEVTREVSFTAAAGAHEVLVTDLPEYMDPTMLRVTSADTDLGAFAVRQDRLPPREDATDPAMKAAKDAVKVAQVALHGAQARVAGIQAEIEAQEAQITFLTGVKMNDAAATAEALSAISQMIGTEVLTARLAALAAAAGLPGAEEEVATAQEDVAQAEAAVEALSVRDADYAALSVAVTAKGGEAHLVVTHFVYEATWSPVYDMVLDRKAGTLEVARGVLVSQASGEDWVGVDLTLSTAQPGAQAEPSVLYPWLRRIEDPVALDDMARKADGDGGMPEPMVAEAAMAMTSAIAGFQGDTVIYRYPAAVDLASGVENLRLALDELNFAPKVVAVAVPRNDKTAFVVATLTNDGAEILLPGTANLYRDGDLTGTTELEALAPGASTDLGFGAIEGIRLKRDMPQRAEGDRGIISTSTQIEESAVLQIENLTDEVWPVRVLDQVPYSEQEELEISYVADPEVSETDVEGNRGVLAWDLDLGPGEKKAITLKSLMSWPEGMVLQ